MHVDNVHVQYGKNEQLEPEELEDSETEVESGGTGQEQKKEICHHPRPGL